MDKHWNSVEELDRWMNNFRSWLIALMEMMCKQIREAQTDVLLPEQIIMGPALARLNQRRSDPMLIDDHFRLSIRRKLRDIEEEIAAHETAAGQGYTEERKIISQAASVVGMYDPAAKKLVWIGGGPMGSLECQRIGGHADLETTWSV